MIVLVTGATGFLGGELVRELVARGQSVRILHRANSDLSYFTDIRDKLQFAEGDILDIASLETAMNGVDEVYHSAAMISYDSADQDRMRKVNVEGTANVVNTALYSGVKKLLYVSSIAAIGGKPGKPIDENVKWEDHPFHTYYGITKMQGEREVYRGIQEGLPAVIINPGIILGAGNDQRKATRRVFNQVASGKLRFYMPGTNGFVDVGDVARASVDLMAGDNSGERYIAVGENMSFRHYFDTIADHFGVPRPKYGVAPWAGRILSRLDWLRHKLFKAKRTLTKENLEVMLQDFYFSNDKLLQALPGFRFKSMKESLLDMAKMLPNG